MPEPMPEPIKDSKRIFEPTPEPMPEPIKDSNQLMGGEIIVIRAWEEKLVQVGYSDVTLNVFGETHLLTPNTGEYVIVGPNEEPLLRMGYNGWDLVFNNKTDTDIDVLIERLLSA
jgi:hypothetical protein